MKLLITLCLCLCASTWLHAQPPVQVDTSAPYGTVPGIYNVANGKLFFTASDPVLGREIWEYGETSAPKVSYDFAGSGISGIDRIGSLNGKIYFSGPTNELYAYDGINPPVQVTNIWPGVGSHPDNLTTLGSKIYFNAQYAGSTGASADLYSYDGVNPPTLHTTVTSSPNSLQPVNIAAVNGKLYMSGINGAGIRTLHVYDPAVNTLTEVAGSGTYPNNFTGAGSKVYYLAYNSAAGFEVWMYDGATASRVTDLAPGSPDGAINGMAYLKGKVYFGGSTNGTDYQLYQLDTASNNVSLAFTVNPGGNGRVSGHFVYKSKVYFIGYTAATGRELWSFDGKQGGITGDIMPGPGSGVDIVIPSYGILNDHLYFGADDGVHGVQLWRINDTTTSDTASQPISVSSIQFNGAVSLYPNPATASATLAITLKGAQSLRIVLTDISGKEVFNTGIKSFTTGTNEIMLPMQSLAPGQYLYRVGGIEGSVLAGGTVIKQ